MAAFTYHRPSDLDEALALLAEHGGDGKVLAGGQSLLPVMAMRLSSPAQLIDIARVGGLDGMSFDSDHLTIGAMARQATVEASPDVVEAAPLLAAALPWIGHRAIRNRGTVCGSLAHADPAAELPAVALALEAEFVVSSSRGTRTVAAVDFFRGYLTTAIGDDELLTAVRFPKRPVRSGYSVQEVSRRHGDFALVGAAVGVVLNEAGSIGSVSISLFGVAGTPVRAVAAERLLTGQQPNDESFSAAAATVSGELSPQGDDHATAAYRRHVAGVLTKRGLQAATKDALIHAGLDEGGEAR